MTKEGALEACGRKWRSTGRLTLGGSKATKEQRSGFEVVRDCFTEGGDSVVGVFCLYLLRAKVKDRPYFFVIITRLLKDNLKCLVNKQPKIEDKKK